MGRRTSLAGSGQQAHQAHQPGKSRQNMTHGVYTVRAPIGIAERRQLGLQHALAQLEREHVALLLAVSELSAGRGATQDRPGSTPALRAALAPMLRADLRQTQYALTRAAQGLYGVCDHCGHAIPLRQLEVRPNATACEGCESKSTARS